MVGGTQGRGEGRKSSPWSWPAPPAATPVLDPEGTTLHVRPQDRAKHTGTPFMPAPIQDAPGPRSGSSGPELAMVICARSPVLLRNTRETPGTRTGNRERLTSEAVLRRTRAESQGRTAPGRVDVHERRRGTEVHQRPEGGVRRCPVLRPPGHRPALHRASGELRREGLHRRADVRRLLDPGVPADP